MIKIKRKEEGRIEEVSEHELKGTRQRSDHKLGLENEGSQTTLVSMIINKFK